MTTTNENSTQTPENTTTESPSAATTSPATSPDNTKSIISLVLGVLSLVCCGFFSGIPAIFVARSELKAVNEGRSHESNRTLSKIGLILGIIGTVLSLLGFLIYAVIFLGAFIFGATNTPSSF